MVALYMHAFFAQLPITNWINGCYWSVPLSELSRTTEVGAGIPSN